jgi:hypothetical protein
MWGVHLVRLRELIGCHKELARKLDERGKKIAIHDQAIAGLIDAIRQLMTPPESKERSIG